jgi:hypothetical protein
MDPVILAKALALAALVAATTEYACLVHRRADMRLDFHVARDSALRGLVRMLVFEEARHAVRMGRGHI